MTLYIILAVVALGFVVLFNGLVRARNRVKESWSDIDVQLKRRYDLIPNLIETVKGYAAHEQGVLEAVVTARAKAMGASSVADHAQAENMLSGALKSLFALSEAYPDLKAVSSFNQLQSELSDIENKIQAARRFYNSNVLALNNNIETFPANMFAGAFGFSKSDFFELDDVAQREPVQVKF